MSIESQGWAQNVEALLADCRQQKVCDVLIIGSGYGGSFAARELAGAAEVWVVERGREYALGEFPEDIGSLPGHVRISRRSKAAITGKPEGLFDVRLFDDVSVLVANGLGGGSLINAGVALKPDPDTIRGPDWPSEFTGFRKGELFRAMGEVESTLQACELAGASALGKYQALSVLADKAGLGSTQPVPVTIASHDRTTPTGLHQPACTRCGNCFTGCNVGAKNTLVSHVIPDAARRGVRFFTGGIALTVEPVAAGEQLTDTGRPVRWRVNFARTANAREPARAVAEFQICANVVILAAGTLGSTELLLRSSLSHSQKLGHSFSTNGDAIAMGWGMKPAVNGISAPHPGSTGPGNNVGSTIVGTAHASLAVNGRKVGVLLQDGAVPSALAQAGIALGSALSFAHRYTRDEGPAAYATGSDPLALPQGIGEHALLLLGMGEDPAKGVVSLIGKQDPTGKSRVPGNLQIQWPADQEGSRHAYQEAFDQLLSDATAAGGLQGGDYLANPAWRPFPPAFSAVSGEPPRKMITVHPLGGCPMGDDGLRGAVDWKGAVFRGEDQRVHEGLYVMDGAMVPSSLGVNPFVTIAALSVLAARQLRAELARHRVPVPLSTQRCLPAQQPSVPPLAFQPAGPIEVSFEERLQGAFEGSTPAWLEQLATRAGGPVRSGFGLGREWVAKVTVRLDLHAWLADPGLALPATLELFENRFSQELTVVDEALRGTPLLRGCGTVKLLALDAPGDRQTLRRRTLEAYRTYFSRRSTLDLKSVTGGGSIAAAVAGFKRAARNHAWQRTLSYDFKLSAAGVDAPEYQACGEKRLAYARSEKNVWDALTQLDLDLAPIQGGAGTARLALKVDLVDLVRNSRLQVSDAPNTPAVVVGLASFASLWTRAIFMTHFWSFRGSNAEAMSLPEPAQHGLLRPRGLIEPACEPQRIRLQVPAGPTAPGELIDLELTRYQPLHRATGEHILMIHGLAHGGTVFTTDTVGTDNMATAFLEQGYCVWILDHRLSNRLPHKLRQHTMDDIARHDIPAAVRHVHACAGRKIKVFAHCVGGGAFAMAALAGHLGRGAGSMIDAAAIHAVHPWLVPSASNQLSAALAAFYKDLLEDDDSVNPLPDKSPRLFDELLDRFAASIPWPDEELHRHERHKYDVQGGCAVCNRMTVFYGREWVHENLSETTHERLASLVGPASIEVFRQLYFVMLRQRLTDRQGSNAYLTQGNVKKNFDFPVLFCHGRENKVFNPRGAVRSWNRLTAIRRYEKQGGAVKLFIADGYGHMDFLFGRKAHRDIFPDLLEFMKAPDSYPDRWTWREGRPPVPPLARDWELSDLGFRTPKSLLTGPMIQLEGTGLGKRVVLWFEQRQHATSRFERPTMADDGNRPQTLIWKAFPLNELDAEPSRSATLNGAGVFWTATLQQSYPGQFAGLGRLRLDLRSEDPDIEFLDAARGRATLAARVPAGGDEPEAPPDEQTAPVLDWGRLPWWRRWIGEPVSAPVSWLATSCRWPGLPFERDAPDLLAAAMHAHVESQVLPVDALVLLGDQIYADATADVADTTEMEERGAQRYRDAWGGEHTRKLLASLPTYMVVDDHEYRDGWVPGEDPSRDPQFMNGFQAAYAYQWRWHTRECEPQVNGSVVRGFWREFTIGDIPAFAADTRSERCPKGTGDWMLAQLMSGQQMDAIEGWLLRHKDRPKVLCSGSVFGIPQAQHVREPALCRSADGWLGYPASWRRLAAFIAVHQVRNLIFLSGDYHLSAVAELEIAACGAAQPVRAISVVCSGWNATLPFANRNGRDLLCGEQVRSPLSGPEAEVWSTTQLLSTASRQFSKLTLAPVAGGWELQVRVYSGRDCLRPEMATVVRL